MFIDMPSVFRAFSRNLLFSLSHFSLSSIVKLLICSASALYPDKNWAHIGTLILFSNSKINFNVRAVHRICVTEALH